MKLGGLRTKMVVFFSLLLIAVQGVAFFVVNRANGDLATRRSVEQIDAGQRIFGRLLEENRRKLTGAAQVLAADYGFRSAVGMGDVPTTVSVLVNHGGRIGADLMMVLSLDHEVIAATPGSEDAFTDPVHALLDRAEQEGATAGLVNIRYRVFETVVVPVLAPDPIAWVVIGLRVNDALAADLASLTGLEVTFMSHGDNGWRMIASTREPLASSRLLEWVDSPETLETAAPSAERTTWLEEFATLAMPLNLQSGSPAVAVLQRSTADFVAARNDLRDTLIVLAIISILASVIGSIIVAHGIARPLLMLANVASKIREGDYSEAAQIAQRDEIGLLADSFNQMRDNISVLLRLAYRDVLTNLPNRAMFNDRLNQALKVSKRTSQPFTLMMMDLNKFKSINDTLGHEAGDEVIKVVGARLAATLRESDTVARLGGDEFAIILATGDPNELAIVATKIRGRVKEPIPFRGQEITISCSIGAAFFPEHGEGSVDLLRRADLAMYAAKYAGGDRLSIFAPDLERGHEQPASLADELRIAIDTGQLRLHYQPTVDVSGSQLTGVEALTYWQHPGRGLLSPDDFIPLAERHGLIGDLTTWLIDTAVAQCAEWRARGEHIPIAVNLSEHDLRNPRIVTTVRKALDQHAVPAHMLSLEIPERVVFEPSVQREDTIRKLAALGVRLAIDNYGASYTAMAYIKGLPLAELKIDRAFIADMAEHSEGENLVRLAIELGHNLGFNIVAEGVESEKVMSTLGRLGCDQAQGFLMSRPLPPAEFLKWLGNSGRAASARPEADDFVAAPLGRSAVAGAP